MNFLQIQELDISRNRISNLSGLKSLCNLTVSILMKGFVIVIELHTSYVAPIYLTGCNVFLIH